MSKFLLIGAFAVVVGCTALLHFPVVVALAAAQAANPGKLVAGPELEMTNNNVAIVRWTTTNPGGTDLHYGIVHYGPDAMHLTQLAKSPNRRNPSHPEMTFRVRIANLNPHTIYYYSVESAGATGLKDGPPSPVRSFTTH